jgi:hypothetical protein
MVYRFTVFSCYSFSVTKGVENYTLKGYPGVAHTLSIDMIQDAKQFLLDCLPPVTPEDPRFADFNVKPKSPREMSMKEIKEFVKDNRLQAKTLGMSEKSEFIQLILEYYQTEYGIQYE